MTHDCCCEKGEVSVMGLLAVYRLSFWVHWPHGGVYVSPSWRLSLRPFNGCKCCDCACYKESIPGICISSQRVCVCAVTGKIPYHDGVTSVGSYRRVPNIVRLTALLQYLNPRPFSGRIHHWKDRIWLLRVTQGIPWVLNPRTISEKPTK